MAVWTDPHLVVWLVEKYDMRLRIVAWNALCPHTKDTAFTEPRELSALRAAPSINNGSEEQSTTYWLLADDFEP